MEENMNVVNEIEETTENCEVTENGKVKAKAGLIIVAGGVIVGTCIACRHKIKDFINKYRIKRLEKQGYVVIPNTDDVIIDDSEIETEN